MNKSRSAGLTEAARSLPDWDGGGEIIAVVGATATGKTALADAWAAALGGEVISADSMQVYRGMDIGTAKVPPEQRSVPYHGLDLVDPGQPFTAALYQRYARSAIADIRARGQRVVFCGGTGLYLRAALDDFQLDEAYDEPEERGSATDEQPGLVATTTAADLRQQLLDEAQTGGPAALHSRLVELDPASAELIHPNNVRRVVRALELLEQGLSYAETVAGFSSYISLYPVRYIGLSVERELLYQLIEARVDAMLADGLLGEVQVLLSAGLEQALTASQAIGYRQLIPVLQGQCTLAEATLAIKQATRRYAKRQQTWFKRDPRIEWLDASDLAIRRLADSISPSELGQLLYERAQTQLGSRTGLSA